MFFGGSVRDQRVAKLSLHFPDKSICLSELWIQPLLAATEILIQNLDTEILIQNPTTSCHRNLDTEKSFVQGPVVARVCPEVGIGFYQSRLW